MYDQRFGAAIFNGQFSYLGPSGHKAMANSTNLKCTTIGAAIFNRKFSYPGLLGHKSVAN